MRNQSRSWIIVSLCIAASCPVATAATEFYVSPVGDDNNPGTKAKPFATLARARDAARQVPVGRSPRVTVQLRGGNYFLAEPVVLDDRDSGVAFRAAKGEKPVVYGGTRITGWQKWKKGIYRAKAPQGSRFFRLIHNRRAAVMARHPNKGSGYGVGFRKKSNTSVSIPAAYRNADYSDAQVFGFVGANWFSEMREVVKHEGGLLTVDAGSGGFGGLNNRIYVRGVLALLDEPGEWCLRRKEGTVYYWPPAGGGLADDIVVAPRMQRAIEVKGRSIAAPARDIRFEGITFIGSDFCPRWWLFSRGQDGSMPPPLQHGLIYGENVQRLVVRGCKILWAGHSGVYLNNYAQECVVEDCWIEGAGFAGIYMNSYVPARTPFKTAAEAYINKKHRIVGNFTYDCGHFVGHGCGIQFFQSGENDISHNRVAKMPRYGISYKGNRYGILPAKLYGKAKTFENHFEVLHSRKNRIAYNDISGVCRDSFDFGGIEAWGPGRDNVWEYNAVHDIDQTVSWDGWAHGLFPDDGTHYHTVRGNIVYWIQGGKATACVMCKSGRQVVENNIFAENIVAWVFTDMPYIEPAFEQVIRRNIILGRVPKIYGKSTGHKTFFKKPAFTEVDRNIYWPQPPQLAAYRKTGWDKNAVVVDPGFAMKNKPWNRTYRDFRLRPDSPAAKAGFQPIDVDKIGLRDSFPFDRRAMFRKPAWEEIEAEDYDRMQGLRTIGGHGIHLMAAGAWAKYENVDFGERPLTQCRMVMTGDAVIELRLDSPTGRCIGRTRAGERVVKIEPVKGRQTLFLVFRGRCLLDSFTFTAAGGKGTQ